MRKNGFSWIVCIILIATAFSCGSYERSSEIEAQRAVEAFIDSLRLDEIETQKLRADSILKAQKADSLQQIVIADSLKKAEWLKKKAWLESQNTNTGQNTPVTTPAPATAE